MPLFGQLDLRAVLPGLPEMRHFDTEPWELPGAQLLYLAYEVEAGVIDPRLPKALHPAVLRYVTILVTQYPESPVGPFRLAQLRLMARAGVHPRGYVVRAYTDQNQAATELRRRWGFPAETADDIRVRVHHDRIFATVRQGGRTLLDCALSHYEVVAGTDIN
jgi:Acetoacetate decarboxylase (ADC)